MEDRAFPPLDRLNVLLHRGRFDLRSGLSVLLGFWTLFRWLPMVSVFLLTLRRTRPSSIAPQCLPHGHTSTERTACRLTPTLWKKLQARSARNSSPTHCKQVHAGPHPVVRKMLFSTVL